MIEYSFFPTDSRLSEFIFSYGLMSLNHDSPVPMVSPPNGLAGFVIRTTSINAELRAKDIYNNPIAHQPSYVMGQMTFPIAGFMSGEVKGLMVFFHPLGLYQLFGCNMSALTDKSIDLIDFLGVEKGEALIANLLATNNAVDRQVTVLNEFFLKLLPIKNDCGPLKKALPWIHEARGNITVKEVEAGAKISRRSLERHFKEKIGVSPKVYIRIFRFKCIMNYLKENPGTTWAELSHIGGFFDQSHFIKHFKENLPVSPAQLVTLNSEFIHYLLHY